MRILPLLASVFLLSFFLSVNAFADEQVGGSTLIGATVTSDTLLNMSFEYSDVFIPENYTFYQNLTLDHVGGYEIYVYLNKTDGNDFVKFVNDTGGYQDTYTILLPINTSRNVTVKIYVPPGQGYDGGVYNVPMYATSLNDSTSNSTTLQIRVNSTNPVDDIEIKNIYPSSLYRGESLDVDISIHKIYPTEITDIQICYCIKENPDYSCGPSDNNYGCAWKAITEWLNYTKTVTVNENPGTYYFIVAVSYPEDSSIKKANSPQFYVLTTPSGPSGGGGGIFIPTEEISGPNLTIMSPDYLEASPGETIEFEVQVKNMGNSDVPGTTLEVYGMSQNWISVIPKSNDIDAGDSKNYSVSLSLPGNALEQMYHLFLVAKSDTEEVTKMLILAVARDIKDRARLLLEEALSKKKEVNRIVDKAEDYGMYTAEFKKTFLDINSRLEETENLFRTGNYERVIEKSKEIIEDYRSVINFLKGVFRDEYFYLLNEVVGKLNNLGAILWERGVIESINTKVSNSIILEREGRYIEAYETLFDAKQLLEKNYFREIFRNIILIPIAVIAIIAIIVIDIILLRRSTARFREDRLSRNRKHT